MKGYTFADSLKYGFFLIYTKLVWRKARLVRLPVLIRNRKNISYGQGFTCGTGCRINPGSKGRLVIGKDFVMGDYCQIEAMNSIRIGNGVLLASRVYIGDACHGVYKGKGQSSPMIPPSKREIASGKLVIGDNVWIGNGVSILGGGVIGNGAIIGANTVVTKNVPENSIVVGNPMRIIKRYDPDMEEWVKISETN